MSAALISANSKKPLRRPAMPDAPLLEITNVETSYGLSRVLFGVSLGVAAGEMVSLMGRNGMGKTTTVRSIMGLTAPAAGSIRLSGVELRGLPAYRIAKLGIGLVPEGRQVFANLTARENLLATAANRNGIADPWTIEKIFAFFPRLAERAGAMANLLSGGEQQMLAVGRALMSFPRCLLLDEPSLGLSPKAFGSILDAVNRINAEGVPVLIAEQNVRRVLKLVDYAYVLEAGRIEFEGGGEHLMTDSRIRRSYLGMDQRQ
jgi:branched-chain amino acid transport system ATP-binding protein